MVSIMDLPQTVGQLKKEERELFDRFFRIRVSQGELVVPKGMIEWANKTFGDYKLLEKQKIIMAYNKFTSEDALFNEIRSKRPMSAKSSDDSAKAIADSKGDSFCDPEKQTPSDTFGRVKGKYCITASNVAKYDALHGLVIFKKHDPLDVTERELQDYFATALKWLEKANKTKPNAKYPYILWNCLWKSGASIIHGHMQMVLGEAMHYGESEHLNKIRKTYSAEHKTDYFEDLYKVHASIGLGMKSGNIKIFTSLNPAKDKEITIISEALDAKMVKAVYTCIDSLKKEFGVESYNLGVLMPPLEKKGLFSKKQEENEWKGFPVIAKVIDRGKLSNKTTDFAGLELFENSKVIETDPYVVFDKIKARLEKK